MMMNRQDMEISYQAQRRFILGKQGLWPGRRWQGAAGAAQAMREGVVVQIDPLNMIARSHDLALHSRVADYSPDTLMRLMYTERGFFDYGGVVRVQPMEALPYWRVVMARVGERRAYLADQNQAAVALVLAALRERGPLANRDFTSDPGQKKYWHAAKATSQALYYLWLKGEVMTHSRRGFERCFDLAERIVPQEHDWTASADDAEAYFELRAMQELGLTDMREWRNHWMGFVERKISMAEATERLEALVAAGVFARVRLEDGAGGKDPLRYLLAEDLSKLEAVQAGRLPEAWQPQGATSEEEAVFLAPLDIVSARGRAAQVFQFEYVWEVYKPVEERRWGYYVLPVLYGDWLVARFDAAVDRKNRTLKILRFWAEDGVECEEARFRAALEAGLKRLAGLVGAEKILHL